MIRSVGWARLRHQGGRRATAGNAFGTPWERPLAKLATVDASAQVNAGIGQRDELRAGAANAATETRGARTRGLDADEVHGASKADRANQERKPRDSPASAGWRTTPARVASELRATEALNRCLRIEVTQPSS